MSLDAMFDKAAANAAPVASITIRRPDDWHVHLRDGTMLNAVLPFTAAQFARGIIMPNLVPPVTTVEAASAYRDRILAARPQGSDRRNKEPDPNSPFAKLAALKQQLEQNKDR